MGGGAAPDRAGEVRSLDVPPQRRGAQGAARDEETKAMATTIDKRLYRKAMAGFSVKLSTEDQKLPRALRRVLAGVRRPRTAAVWREPTAQPREGWAL